MPKTYSYRQLLKKLREHDSRFEEHVRRGKGSERMIYRPDVDGRPESYPLTCHSEGADVRPGHLGAIRRRFRLPRDLF